MFPDRGYTEFEAIMFDAFVAGVAAKEEKRQQDDQERKARRRR